MLPRLIAKQISKLTRYLLRNFDSSRRPPHIRSTKIGFEGEGTRDCGLLIADCRFQIGKFVGRFCETPSI
jgi:hypothetical protein